MCRPMSPQLELPCISIFTSKEKQRLNQHTQFTTHATRKYKAMRHATQATEGPAEIPKNAKRTPVALCKSQNAVE